MVGEREPPWHAGGGEDGESELVNGGAGGSDGGRFSHHNRLARVGSYQRQRPPRTQKRQAAHLGPNAQGPPCRRLLDLHRLRNVQPRRLDPPPPRFGPNRLRRSRKRERARERERRRFGGGNGEREREPGGENQVLLLHQNVLVGVSDFTRVRNSGLLQRLAFRGSEIASVPVAIFVGNAIGC